jgi:organic radical activating enzyme
MSQLDNGFVSLDELKNWYQTWNKKIAPYRVSLLGGEPLLHPQIEEVITETVQHWPHAQIDILTNGLVLPQKSKTVLKLLKKINASILITKHFDDPDYNEKFNAAIACMKEYGIRFDISVSYLGWSKMYEMSDSGKPLPFHSDYKKAWDNCSAKNNCLTIMDNELHKCATLSAYYRMAMLKKISTDWNRVLTYKPLTKDTTKAEILKHITSGAIPECSVCPEKHEFIPTSEVSSKFHQICKKKKIKAA